MALTATAAAWFLVAVFPISVYVAYNDLARMKIPNTAVYALVISFAVIGLFVLPIREYLWQWSHLPVMLVIGMILNAIGAMGAGDAKFLAAAAPFVGLADIDILITSLAACVLVGVATHRIAKNTKLRNLAPNWESWDQEKRRFPMGFPLGMALVTYLVAIIIQR